MHSSAAAVVLRRQRQRPHHWPAARAERAASMTAGRDDAPSCWGLSSTLRHHDQLALLHDRRLHLRWIQHGEHLERESEAADGRRPCHSEKDPFVRIATTVRVLRQPGTRATHEVSDGQRDDTARRCGAVDARSARRRQGCTRIKSGVAHVSTKASKFTPQPPTLKETMPPLASAADERLRNGAYQESSCFLMTRR
eukprot:scaffold3092_cov121-Isochrysis_galbana.AAC.1